MQAPVCLKIVIRRITSNPKHLSYTSLKPGYTFIPQLENVQINKFGYFYIITYIWTHDNDIETRNYWSLIK